MELQLGLSMPVTAGDDKSGHIYF